MYANHDRFTQQMCDGLKTTCMGLGLVRLLQDANRFEEARTTLYALENPFHEAPDKPSREPFQANRLSRRTRSRRSWSSRIGAA